MQIPGFIWPVLYAGVTALGLALVEALQVNVSEAWVPIAVAAIGAILKAVEVWNKPDTATRSIQQPRSGLRRFFLGEV